MNLLAADIGGTNTRLVFAAMTADEAIFQVEKTYPSTEFDDFYLLLDEFLHEYKISDQIDSACFGVAGPVKNGIAAVTNLPWLISEQEISRRYQITHVKLINDFIAIVYGIETLADNELLVLQQAKIAPIKNPPDAAVIGAGTGLGVAHRLWLDDHYVALSSEAGHTGFSPQNELQLQLLSWLQKHFTDTSLELLLSGRGLSFIYQFLEGQGAVPASAEISAAIKKHNAAQVITSQALMNTDELCVATLNCFIDIYGAAAGNAALYYYPVDEVYIAGGIAPKIKNKLLNDRFLTAFTAKGLMSSNMKNITIKLILNEKVGIQGALLMAKNISAKQHSGTEHN